MTESGGITHEISDGNISVGHSQSHSPHKKTRRTDVCQCAGMNSFQFREPLSYLPQIVAQMVLSVSF